MSTNEPPPVGDDRGELNPVGSDKTLSAGETVGPQPPGDPGVTGDPRSALAERTVAYGGAQRDQREGLWLSSTAT